MDTTLTHLHLAKLPVASQTELDRWEAAFAAITGPVTRAFKELAAQFGVSEGTVRRKYYLRKELGLAGLVNGNSHPTLAAALRADSRVSEETFEHFRQLCLDNGRKCAPAYRKLVRLFFDGEPIPGLPPGTPRNRLPAGWTKSNFMNHAPTPFEMRAARQGLRRAAEFRPLVYTSRAEMYFFQELQFDDMWHDIETSHLSYRQRVRPLQLGSMEVLSACLFQWCIKPRIRREDDTRTNLGPNDLLFLLASILGRFGHNPRGTRLNFEAGTACPSDEAIDLIHKLSGGVVQCRIGKTGNSPAFLGQYPGASKGNFRTRALLESFWNLSHNETADRLQFPGQTGAIARIDAPEDLHGRSREQDLILRAAPALPEHVFRTLRMPFPEFTQARYAIDEINERMNQRGIMPGTEHAIEGFAEAGLVTTDFDLPGLGLITRAEFERRLSERTEQERAAILALCTPVARKLSPREVFDLGLRNDLPAHPIRPPSPSGLTKWRPEALALLLYPARLKDVVTVGKDHCVTFENEDISPEPLRFLAHHFIPGDTFEAVINPMVPDLLFIYDARPSHRGAWLGILQSWGRASKANAAAVQERMGEAERIKHQLLRPVVQRGMEITKARLESTEHNNTQIANCQAADDAADDEVSEALSQLLK